jgi:5-methylcytosine-specific restriction protein A
MAEVRVKATRGSTAKKTYIDVLNFVSMSTPWTDAELKKSIEAYFKMLKYEKDKTPYVKAEINRNLQLKLPNRSRESIEYRWQNISSVLNDEKLKYVEGYKPAKNVGSSVKERIWKIIKELELIKQRK